MMRAMRSPDRTLAAFGRNVARIRSQRGLSQDKLAEEAELDRTYVSGIERGVRNPATERRSPYTIVDLRVRPDFVFPKLNVAVFVDGCFWHGCPRHSSPARWLRRSAMPRVARQDAKAPRTGKRFWRDKLAANRKRDRLVNRALRSAGWRVVRVWEHQLPQRGTGNAERGTLKSEVGKRNAERGTRGGKRGMRNSENGTGNPERGTSRLVAKLRRWVC